LSAIGAVGEQVLADAGPLLGVGRRRLGRSLRRERQQCGAGQCGGDSRHIKNKGKLQKHPLSLPFAKTHRKPLSHRNAFCNRAFFCFI
jgi:hypothetical protein